ncbi:MAG TPA: hypothetical protein DDZ76_15235 [Xanthomonadales bacterium]|nr:hypothetical protein [Xanthomonadales bacterium]
MRIRVLLSVSAICLVAACATTSPPLAESKATIRSDAEYMQLVERVARRRGVALRWVNPPNEPREDDSLPR